MTERRRADPQRTTLPPVPIGLQRLLRRAAADPAFRERLVSARAVAASEAGIALNGSERAMLDAVSGEQLRTMIAAVPPRPALPATRRRATAAAVVLLGGAAVSDCRSGEERSTNHTPDTTAVVADASIALHTRCGFQLVGIEREVGRKFSRWHDVVLMQALLK